MRYYMDWRDYVNQPHIKQLIESKGVAAAKTQYLKESNSALWFDPFIISEAVNPGVSLANNNSTAGGSTQFIVGDTAQISTFTWTDGVTNNITGSIAATGSGDGLQGFYFDLNSYNGTIDYSGNHISSTKTFRFYVVSSSNFIASDTTGIDGIVTASYTDVTETTNITGSILTQWSNAIASQTATATIAGFTNTIAPNELFTSSIASNVMTFTNLYKGGVPQIQTNFTSTTASVATTTVGADRIWNPTNYYTGASTFNGSVAPYTMMPRRNT
jgi:hypothetical protein